MIAYKNINFIWWLIDSFCIWFYEVKQSKYELEMLHFWWLLFNKVISNELQQSILSSSFVNLTDWLNFFKIIDFVLKHVNYYYIINIKLHKNSTYDISKIFEHLTLISFYITQLCTAIKSHFNEKINFKHSKKSALKDIFSLAHHVWAENCI